MNDKNIYLDQKYQGGEFRVWFYNDIFTSYDYESYLKSSPKLCLIVIYDTTAIESSSNHECGVLSRRDRKSSRDNHTSINMLWL